MTTQMSAVRAVKSMRAMEAVRRRKHYAEADGITRCAIPRAAVGPAAWSAGPHRGRRCVLHDSRWLIGCELDLTLKLPNAIGQCLHLSTMR